MNSNDWSKDLDSWTKLYRKYLMIIQFSDGQEKILEMTKRELSLIEELYPNVNWEWFKENI